MLFRIVTVCEEFSQLLPLLLPLSWVCCGLSCSALSSSLHPCSLPGSFVHGDPTGKNAGVVFHALLQGIFPTQGMSLWKTIKALKIHDGKRQPPWLLQPLLSYLIMSSLSYWYGKSYLVQKTWVLLQSLQLTSLFLIWECNLHEGRDWALASFMI